MKWNIVSVRAVGTPLLGHRWRTALRSLAVAATTLVVLAPFAPGTGTASATNTAPAPSSGCAAAPAAPGSTVERFAGAGRSGTYIRDIPAAPAGPRPVVLDLHGFLESADIAHLSSGFGDLGAARGFVTVTPQLEEPGPPRWNFAPQSPDIGWLAGLVDHLGATLCVDTRRIFVTGLSMGAFTTSSLACQLSDRIAAVAPVAGIQDFAWCNTSRPVPVIAFHGTADPIVAYTGGLGPNARFLPSPDGTGSAADLPTDGPAVYGPGPGGVPDATGAWARRNGCGTAPERRQPAPGVALDSYPCPAGAEVELYSLDGVGHVWPGNTAFPFPEIFVGRNTTAVRATELIWEFFEAHPLPQ